jgi:serine phosphatase RsbU (regulator of sigma subunit)/ligand-binding sensor domain-containing protein
MRKIFHIFLLTLFCVHTLFGQVNKYGIPLITNYTPEEYGASEQNWAIVQDQRGVMYFGNNDGVLEYDGKNWRLIKIPNNTIVRSLAYHDDVIYVGAQDEFGYLEPNSTGRLQYVSLSNQLDSTSRLFGDVWKINIKDDEIYFQGGYFKIFRYRNFILNKIFNLHFSPLFSFFVYDKIYFGTYGKGLLELKADSFQVAKGGDFFYEKNITSISASDSNVIVVGTLLNGVYTYNTKTGEVSEHFLTSKCNTYLKQNLIYNGINLADRNFVFGTIEKGAVVINEAGRIKFALDKKAGLQDEMIYNIYSDNSGISGRPIWLAMDLGISKAEIGSPISVFGEGAGLKGSVLDIIQFKGTLYVGTMRGLFYLEYDESGNPHFERFEEISNCWSLIHFSISKTGDEKLLAGTSYGVFEITGKNNIISIEDQIKNRKEDIYYETFALYQSTSNPSKLLIGNKAGLSSLTLLGDSWVDERKLKKLQQYEVRSIAEDVSGNIWLGTFHKGVLKIELTISDTIIHHFDSNSGFPSLKDLQVYNYNNNILLATQTGLYKYHKDSESFIPDSSFDKRFIDGSRGIYRFSEDANGNHWMACNKQNKYWIEFTGFEEDGNYSIDTLPFMRLPNRQIEIIYNDVDGITWFGISNKLFSYKPNITKSYQQPFKTLIRKITLGEDSVIFFGTNFTSDNNGKKLIGTNQPKDLKPVINYKYRHIIFEFAAPFFEREDATQFSYLMEGFNTKWSGWTTESRIRFDMKEGEYNFKVKANNIYNTESEVASFQFKILPPWHRTILAYIIYVILIASTIWGIVTLNARRLIREKHRLELIVQRRTAEVRRQKNEIEKQRDMAERQKDRIARQNKEIRDSIKYARRIQTAILPPGDYLSDKIPYRFVLYLPKDIVSGDFYWLSETRGKIIVTVADCTGHGVPGAFMSMLGTAFLNEIVNKSKIIHPNEILNRLRIQVITSLRQKGELGESHDGMDIALYVLDMKNKNLEFAGANNPLILFRNKELIQIKGDKMPIGIHTRSDKPFTNHEMNILEEDVLYVFSDGFADQFGGPDQKKFMVKQLKNLLTDIHELEMEKQRDILENTFLEWKGKNPQIDDILILGVKI